MGGRAESHLPLAAKPVSVLRHRDSLSTRGFDELVHYTVGWRLCVAPWVHLRGLDP